MVSRSDIEQSDTVDHGVRLGLFAYGVVHLLVAYTAARLAFGDHGKADQQGALSKLAQSPGGGVGLWVLAAGFLCLVLWQVYDALLGHTDEDGIKRLGRRLASAGRVAVYLALGASAVQKAAGGSSGSSGTDSTTAKVMQAPGGQWLVGAVGLGILGVAGFLVFRGLTQRFTDDLDSQARSRDRRAPIIWLGRVGYTVKGIALGVVGVLFTTAAVQYEPKKSGGLDQALRTLLQQPFGPYLILGVALGLAAFGLYCFAWARHLDR